MNNEDFEDLDDVSILHSQFTGETVRPASAPTPVLHERAFPLPQRVRNGSFEPEGVVLEGNLIPWAEVQLLGLGLIHHSLGSMEPPKTVVRQVFSKITNKASGGGASSTRKENQYQESQLIDIYGPPSLPPYRLDSVNLNYRAFLGRDVAMISFYNFYRFAVRLARGAIEARVNASFAHLIRRRRDQIRPFAAVYDFELECQNALSSLDSLTPTAELDLSRDNYAEGVES